jgi:nucleotide-binding universal stress UspA family protein
MFPIKTILCPTDFSELSDRAFEIACALANDYQARVVLTHVVIPAPVVYGGELGPVVTPPAPSVTEFKAHLEAIKPPVAIPVEYRLRKGDAAKEILRLAEETHADLIVMGTHGRKGLPRLLIGSVAEAVLRRAPCLVLTVKAPVVEAVSTTTAEEKVLVHA